MYGKHCETILIPLHLNISFVALKNGNTRAIPR